MLALSAARGISTTLSTNGSNVRSLSALSDMVERGSLRVGVSLNGDCVPADLHHYITAHRPLLKSVCTRDRVLPGAAIPYLGDPRVEYYLIYLDTLSREELALGMPFHEFSDTLAALSARYANIRGVYCSGFVAGQGDPLLQQVRCPAGTTKLSVMPDGDIYPCYLLMGHGEFRLGNVREDGFAAVMEHPALDFFRRYEGNPCARSACALIGLCHGGCPAVSLRITGDLSRPDPRCSPDEETHSRTPAAKILKKKDRNGNMT
jgi:radical SAM protein with 4Fe4S-binding SPASM domain